MGEIYKGADIVYPVFNIITPQTKHNFVMKSLTVQDEELLRTSSLTTGSMASHINKVLFSCITECSDKEVIKDIETFQKNITTLDREALLFGLYVSSYGSDYSVEEYSCHNCQDKPINGLKTINLAELVTEAPYEGKPGEILKKRTNIHLDISGIDIVVKLPTIQDEIECGSLSNEFKNQVLIIDNFSVPEKGTDSVDSKQIYYEKENIERMFKSLPVRDRKKIFKNFEKDFLQNRFDIKKELKCNKCGTTNIIRIEIFQEFFRMVHEV